MADTTHVGTNRGVFDEACHLTPSHQEYTDFDYSAVDAALGHPEAEERNTSDDAQEFGDLLRVMWDPPGDLRTARRRFDRARKLADQEGATPGAEAFLKILRWTKKGQRDNPDASFHVWVAACATIDPKLVASKPYAHLAAEMGLCKAATSKQSRDFREYFRFFYHEIRDAEGRARMRAARLRQVDSDGRVIPRKKAPASQ